MIKKLEKEELEDFIPKDPFSYIDDDALYAMHFNDIEDYFFEVELLQCEIDYWSACLDNDLFDSTRKINKTHKIINKLNIKKKRLEHDIINEIAVSIDNMILDAVDLFHRNNIYGLDIVLNSNFKYGTIFYKVDVFSNFGLDYKFRAKGMKEESLLFYICKDKNYVDEHGE